MCSLHLGTLVPFSELGDPANDMRATYARGQSRLTTPRRHGAPSTHERAVQRRGVRAEASRNRHRRPHGITGRAGFKRKVRKPCCGPAPPETEARSCGSPFEPRGRDAQGSKGLQIPSIRNQRVRSRGRVRAAPPGVRTNQINPLAPNFPAI
jgi:hypothetical protein